MRQHFEIQLHDKVPITEDMLSKMKSKTYESGIDIKIGDTLLLALLVENADEIIILDNFAKLTGENDVEKPEYQLRPILLQECDFDDYEYIKDTTDNYPIVKKKLI